MKVFSFVCLRYAVALSPMFRIMSEPGPGTGGSSRDIEYRTTITAPGIKPLAVRWTTSTLTVNVTFVVVTDPPPRGRVAEVSSLDNTVMFNASGALSCQLRITFSGTAAQIDPAAATTMVAVRESTLSHLRNMRITHSLIQVE